MRLGLRIAALLAVFLFVGCASPPAAAWRVPLTSAPLEWHFRADCPYYPGVPEIAGCAYADGRIYITRTAYRLGARQVRWTGWHEYGHEWDYHSATDYDRAAYAAITGEAYDPERFADRYAQCAVGNRFEGNYAPGTPRHEHIVWCRYLQRLAGAG